MWVTSKFVSFIDENKMEINIEENAECETKILNSKSWLPSIVKSIMFLFNIKTIFETIKDFILDKSKILTKHIHLPDVSEKLKELTENPLFSKLSKSIPGLENLKKLSEQENSNTSQQNLGALPKNISGISEISEISQQIPKVKDHINKLHTDIRESVEKIQEIAKTTSKDTIDKQQIMNILQTAAKQLSDTTTDSKKTIEDIIEKSGIDKSFVTPIKNIIEQNYSKILKLIKDTEENVKKPDFTNVDNFGNEVEKVFEMTTTELENQFKHMIPNISNVLKSFNPSQLASMFKKGGNHNKEFMKHYRPDELSTESITYIKLKEKDVL